MPTKTVRISAKTFDRLQKLKEYPRETMDDVIQKLIEYDSRSD